MPTGSDDLKEINAALLAALIDCRAMLEHYVNGTTIATTNGQARSCIRDANAAILKTRVPT